MPNADDKLQAYTSTVDHINEVRKLLRIMVVELLKRGDDHDKSKLSEEEFQVFTTFTSRLKTLTYGSEEYKECIREMKPALDHHYSVNSHHPEFYDNGIDGMNLIDIVEMFCDWWAASKRHADGDIRKSLEINTERFKMSPQLVSILKNTVNDLEMINPVNL